MRKDGIGTELLTEKPSITEVLNQAEALIESSRYREAREKLQGIAQTFQIPSISQESSRFHYLRGLLFFRLGEQSAASGEIEEALRIFTTVNAYVSIPERDNLPDFVRENLRKLRDVEIALLGGLQGPNGKENIEAKEMLIVRVSEISNLLEKLTPLAKMHYYAGAIKWQLTKRDEAMEHFERSSIGSMLSKDWAVLARALNGLARIHYFKGDMGLAIQVTEQAITYSLKAGDRHFEAGLRNNLAQYQLCLGLWRPAISSLPKDLLEITKTRVTPNCCTALFRWGHANLLGGHLKESKKAFGKALRLAAMHNLTEFLEVAHCYFSIFYLEVGQLEEAENHVKKALEIAHRAAEGSNNETILWRLLGDVYAAQNQFGKAFKAYATCQNYLAKFLKIPQKDEEAAMYRGMGGIYARQDQRQAARRYFKKALDIFEICGNQWEKAKTFVIAAESGVFTQAEMEPNIAWAKQVFKRLEHAAWVKRVRALLRNAKNSGQTLPLLLARERTEREQIVKALLNCNGNITQAAKKLGLLRQTLQYKIRRYGIEV